MLLARVHLDISITIEAKNLAEKLSDVDTSDHTVTVRCRDAIEVFASASKPLYRYCHTSIVYDHIFKAGRLI